MASNVGVKWSQSAKYPKKRERKGGWGGVAKGVLLFFFVDNLWGATQQGKLV